MGMMDIRRRVIMSEPHKETQTGDIVTFKGTLKAPMGIVANIEPVQSGSGDPSPTNIRPITGWTGCSIYHTKQNLYFASAATKNRYLNTSGGLGNSSVSSVTSNIPVDPAKEYILDTKNYDGATRNICFWSDSAYLGYEQYNTVPHVIHPLTGTTKMRVCIVMNSDTIIAEGSAISVIFPAHGTNQWDEQWEGGAYSTSNGQKAANSGTIRCVNPIPVNPSTTYYCNSAGKNMRVLYYTGENTSTFISAESSLKVNETITTPSNAHYLRFYLGSAYGTTYNNDVAINYPSSTTAYSAYTNTVYDGTLDLNTGVLTAVKATVKLTSMTRTSDYQYYKRNVTPAPALSQYNTDSIRADRLPTLSSVPGSSVAVDGVFISGNSNAIVAKCKEACANSAALFTYLGGELNVCYTMATPVIYQLTPQQLQSIKNTINNIWANTGQVTATFWTHL